MDETVKVRNGETARKAWRKGRYKAAFVTKLSDAEGDAAETQVHLEFGFRHAYLARNEFLTIDDAYEKIVRQLVKMIDQPDKWDRRIGEGTRLRSQRLPVLPLLCCLQSHRRRRKFLMSLSD